MITLSKENVVDYVKSRLDFFNLDGDIKVSAIGEGTVEEDGDGFINFVYRVSDGKHHLIVKQSTLEARSKGSFTLDLNRYKLEYDAMKICAAIVPDLIPKLYDCDEENRVFITEDVSYLRISRFQLLKGVTYPKLADQIARYMAATQFYTSEYYLDTKRFRDLSVHFMNTTMRKIMEVGMFLTSVTPEDTVGRPLDPEFITFSKRICADPAVLLARQKLRHLFMSKGECLIHCDLHTSNIFASQTEAKVIDMEYSFFGPFAYDMGYFTANFIAQYAAAAFRPFETEEARKEFKAYCLFMIRETYVKYFIGFAASAMLGRICDLIPYPDYDDIDDYVQRHNAKCFSIILNREMLVKWESYNSIDEFIQDILTIEEIYCRNIKDLKL